MDIARTALLTEDDLMRLGADARVEIIDGEVVEMSPVGMLHHFIAGNIYDLLKPFVIRNALGYVFMDGLICLLDKEPGGGLRGAQVPDVCFIRKGHILKDFDISRPFPGSPDLAVEVMSPDDTGEEVLKKVRKYLEKGTEQVWVVYPQQEEVHQYLASSPDVLPIYRAKDAVLEAETLFPGLKLTVGDFFILPDLG